MSKRIVIDTNVYVSRYLRPDSVPGKAVGKAWQESETLISLPTWDELRIVLRRKKFARYVEPETLEAFLRAVWHYAEEVSIPTPIRACRDPRDDKFLEVAVHGRADLIVTGDADLLALHPFQGIAILSPAAYLQLV
jgi:putative PIN family toxin of toxin-antitoxin system